MIDQLAATPTPIPFDGEVYEVHPLTIAEQGQLQKWLESQLPDPWASLQKNLENTSLPMEVQKFLYRTALDLAGRKRIFLHTVEGANYVNTFEGMVEVMYLGVVKGRPDFTRDKAREILSRYTQKQLMVIAGRLKQATELDLVLEEGDPKAKAGG
jgi:hypothetical protein